MEIADRELILKALNNNIQLKRLYDEHLVLERELSRFSGLVYLTPEEERQERLLKKRKLEGVDRMMKLLTPYRNGEFAEAA